MGSGRSSSLTIVAPSGILLIISMPQLSALSTTPPFTSAAARLVACCDEPHWASTVVAATSRGSPAREPRGPGDVEGLRADLAHAAADDLADQGGVDAAALDRRDLHRAEQVGRVHGAQAAVALAERRAHRLHDDDVGVLRAAMGSSSGARSADRSRRPGPPRAEPGCAVSRRRSAASRMTLPNVVSASTSA